MSPDFYKVLHITGILMVFLSVGGAVVSSQTAGTSASVKKFVGMLNGAGLLIALIAGFGLFATLGIGFDGWIIAKLGIWLIFGGLFAIVNRKPNLAKVVTIAAIILGGLAAYLAIVKPF